MSQALTSSSTEDPLHECWVVVDSLQVLSTHSVFKVRAQVQLLQWAHGQTLCWV